MTPPVCIPSPPFLFAKNFPANGPKHDYYTLLNLLPKAPAQQAEIPAPAADAAGGRKGLKKAARDGLRKVLEVRTGKKLAENEVELEPDSKKTKMDE